MLGGVRLAKREGRGSDTCIGLSWDVRGDSSSAGLDSRVLTASFYCLGICLFATATAILESGTLRRGVAVVVGVYVRGVLADTVL